MKLESTFRNMAQVSTWLMNEYFKTGINGAEKRFLCLKYLSVSLARTWWFTSEHLPKDEDWWMFYL